jgi:hypothetical protein
MRALDLMYEMAALGGYTITGTTSQSVADKARALRRVNLVKNSLVSRFGGHWSANYREGWLPLVPLYETGTVTFTQDSRSVTGSGTAWTSAMAGRKILGPNSEYYKIASVTNGTTLILSEEYQGETASGSSYHIWKDEYELYPDVHDVVDFINYGESSVMSEAFPMNLRNSYPKSTTAEGPRVFTALGRKGRSTAYATGTVSGTSGTNTLTGSGTSWLSNLKPGYAITIGSTVYHVRNVNSDTEVELYQLLASSPSGATYSAVGKNALVVRFAFPSSQQIVNYSYYCKDYPFVSDDDEDWIAELYPHVIIKAASVEDHLDKKDPNTVAMQAQLLDDLMRDIHVADEGLPGVIRTVALEIPPEARE